MGIPQIYLDTEENKQAINHHSVEVRDETLTKIAIKTAINVPIGYNTSLVWPNCTLTAT